MLVVTTAAALTLSFAGAASAEPKPQSTTSNGNWVDRAGSASTHNGAAIREEGRSGTRNEIVQSYRGLDADTQPRFPGDPVGYGSPARSTAAPRGGRRAAPSTLASSSGMGGVGERSHGSACPTRGQNDVGGLVVAGRHSRRARRTGA